MKLWTDGRTDDDGQRSLLYLINIHWLSVAFDWTRAGHAEGAILSCRMIILPSDVISALQNTGAYASVYSARGGCYSVMLHDHITRRHIQLNVKLHV